MEDVVDYLQTKGYGAVEEVEVMPENVRFGLPPEIVQAIASGADGRQQQVVYRKSREFVVSWESIFKQSEQKLQ